MSNSVLVIGGGIAGIQASLDLANAGAHVILVEREPTIGGIMAVLDKNFPTLDCSICIEAPKMSEVDLHPNIEILSLAEDLGKLRLTLRNEKDMGLMQSRGRTSYQTIITGERLQQFKAMRKKGFVVVYPRGVGK